MKHRTQKYSYISQVINDCLSVEENFDTRSFPLTLLTFVVLYGSIATPVLHSFMDQKCIISQLWRQNLEEGFHVSSCDSDIPG
jgi:hypothetical protein